MSALGWVIVVLAAVILLLAGLIELRARRLAACHDERSGGRW